MRASVHASRTLTRGLLTALAVVSLIVTQAHAVSFTLDWSAVGWSSTSLSETFVNVDGSGVDITAVFSGDTADILSPTPDINTSTILGPLGLLHVNIDENGDYNPIAFTLSFSQSVWDLAYSVADIDSNGSSYDDYYTATANSGSLNPDILTPSPFNQVVGDNGLLGTSADDAQQSLSYIGFNGPITDLTMTYGALNVGNPQQHRFLVGDITFELPQTVPEASSTAILLGIAVLSLAGVARRKQ